MPLDSYLYVEFPIREGNSLFRMRYGILKLPYNNSKIRICDRGSSFSYGHEKLLFKKNRIQIGKLVSECKLFKAVLSHVVEKFAVSDRDVKLRWEKG